MFIVGAALFVFFAFIKGCGKKDVSKTEPAKEAATPATPTINAKGGRDHWPRVSCALLAGGGMRHGQVIGATDKHAAEPTKAKKPVSVAGGGTPSRR